MSDLIKRSDAIQMLDEYIKPFVGLIGDIGSGINGAREIIKSIPTADRPQGWIPCSERLPKIGEHHISEPCLVYCKGGVYAFAELEENIFGQVGWNCERDDDYHEPIGEVVAWMPLPKPWRGADDE